MIGLGPVRRRFPAPKPEPQPGPTPPDRPLIGEPIPERVASPFFDQVVRANDVPADDPQPWIQVTGFGVAFRVQMFDPQGNLIFSYVEPSLRSVEQRLRVSAGRNTVIEVRGRRWMTRFLGIEQVSLSSLCDLFA